MCDAPRPKQRDELQVRRALLDYQPSAVSGLVIFFVVARHAKLCEV